MAINNPNLIDGFDQNNTNSSEPSTGLQDDGYADNAIPLASNHNFMFKEIYRYLQHLKATGVSQWDNNVSYEQYARTMRDGVIYQSLSDGNQGNDPLSSLNTFWVADGLGVKQTYQAVTGSRSLGTTYTNNTGKPIEIYVTVDNNSTAGSWITSIQVDGTVVSQIQMFQSASTVELATLTATIPDGSDYIVATGTNVSLVRWVELR